MIATFDLFVNEIRKEVREMGLEELNTASQVEDAVKGSSGTILIFVNSTCGCAGGIARPALRMALENDVLPDRIATVFAGQDKDATQRARSYFTNQPPSSPSFGLLRNGHLIAMIHRSNIEEKEPEEVAGMLMQAFDSHCKPV